MKNVFAIAALALALSTPAFAQLAATGDLPRDLATDKANIAKTGKTVAAVVSPSSVASNLNELWDKIQTVSLVDLQYAKALADAAGTPGSKMRSSCWGAWITLIQAQQGTNAVGTDGKPLGKTPSPAAFTTAERLGEVVDSLQPSSPFMVACQPVANAAKQDILQFVTMVVSGATSLSALGVAIP